METGNLTTKTAVYVHFPFCLKKCGYCDFVSFKSERADIPHKAYADAVLAELDARLEARRSPNGGVDAALPELSTVFFGGGTPSLWSTPALARVLAGIRERFGRAPTEVTVECNPTSLDLEKAKALRDAGVDRLSIGIQGLDDARLRFLERLHDAESGLRAIDDALASGIGRVSADLIFGVATEDRVETADEAAEEVARIARTGVTHVSAYALTIESNTSFGARARKGELPIAPDDAVVDALLEVERTLEGLGFEHYEVSNYAKLDDAPGGGRVGARSQHNVGYWRGGDYLGLGAGAVGCVSRADGTARRTRNTGDPRRYIAESSNPEAITIEDETLTPRDRLNERIMLGLRLRDGLDLDLAARGVGAEPLPPERARALDRLERTGRIERVGTTIRVPRDKIHLLDGIAAALFV